jgi:[ribosomal protein S5]-alanine N-acetyltransferase
MNAQALLTARLRLEPVADAHLDALVAIHRRNRDAFAGRMARFFRTRRDALSLLTSARQSERYVMVLKSPRTILGMASLQNVENWPFLNATLGYWIDAQYTGHGYTQEAVARLIKYAFTRRGLHRLEANIAPDNAASIQLARALKFRLEGKSERMLYLDGAWRDQLRFAMTVEDWRGDISTP